MLGGRKVLVLGGDKFRDEYSLAFDGTDGHIEIAETTLSVHDTAYSFAFWVKIDSIGGWHPILGDDDDLHNIIAIDQENDRIFIEGNSDNDSMQWNTTQDPLVLGAWNHFAICMDGSGSGKAYQNGVELTMTNDTIGSDLVFKYIGRGYTHYMEGNLSELTIYDITLSASQVKTLYNGREPFSHNDWEKSGNLTRWWRMGDGSFDSYPLIADSSTTTLFGTDLITNGNFDSNVTGWSDNDGGGGGAVTHETSTKYSGAGSAKITWPDPPTDYWGMMTASNVSSVQANTLYLIEAYIYIPSGWDGGDVYLTEGATFGSSSSEQFVKASSSITNQWQLTKTMFRTASDTAGKLYIRASSTPSATKYIFVDSVTMRAVTGGMPSHTVNMTTADFVGDTP